MTPLLDATRNGNLEIIRLLLSNGADANCIHYVSYYFCYQIVLDIYIIIIIIIIIVNYGINRSSH